jgi:penicillin-binding protein 1C
VSGAAPLWQELVGALHRGVPSAVPAEPPGVERVQVSFDGVPEPAREELFLSGTAFARVVAKAPADSRASIAYPAQGQIVAVDPDIPEDAQLMHFRAEGEHADVQWRLNGAYQPSPFWRPQPGRWTLSLHASDGNELDSVQFEVRGVAVRQ